MRIGEIVRTPGEHGPYNGKYALIIGATSKTVDVLCKTWRLTYEKKDLKVVGKIRTGKTYKPGMGPDAKRFQQFDIIIVDRIWTADVVVSDSCYKLADLRKAAWMANEGVFA
ncbi:hypothetical protein M0R72_20395 [Candidatus Pacearchaeota archaeon]|nr:hypothetical protein [Candidatus Pacearchaeota archaeon]